MISWGIQPHIRVHLGMCFPRICQGRLIWNENAAVSPPAHSTPPYVTFRHKGYRCRTLYYWLHPVASGSKLTMTATWAPRLMPTSHPSRFPSAYLCRSSKESHTQDTWTSRWMELEFNHSPEYCIFCGRDNTRGTGLPTWCNNTCSAGVSSKEARPQQFVSWIDLFSIFIPTACGRHRASHSQRFVRLYSGRQLQYRSHTIGLGCPKLQLLEWPSHDIPGCG